jgi:hypothetical protein
MLGIAAGCEGAANDFSKALVHRRQGDLSPQGERERAAASGHAGRRCHLTLVARIGGEVAVFDAALRLVVHDDDKLRSLAGFRAERFVGHNQR